MNGSEAIVRTLKGLGVDVIFGLCGDTTLPLYEALYDIDHGMRHVLTRDERSASFMADAYARFSGRVGVCEGPSGGGATYILPGVAEANGSSVPLVCLTSDIDQADMGRGTLTELDQNNLFRPVTKKTRMLSEAKRPLIVAGAGVVRSGAWDEVTELAHRLDAPVATSIGGKGSIAETDPYALGVIGSNGGLAYRHAFVRSADVIFYVGCCLGSVTTEKWTLPRNGEHRILQLDVDPEEIGLNYDTELGIVADAKRGVAALLQQSRLRLDQSGSAGARGEVLLGRLQRLQPRERSPKPSGCARAGSRGLPSSGPPSRRASRATVHICSTSSRSRFTKRRRRYRSV